MQFRVLGPVMIVGEGREGRLRSRRETALLADLLVHANRAVPAERLIEDVWQGQPSAGAAATLLTHVKNLRKLLEPDRATRGPSQVLVRSGPGYVLRVDPDQLDATRAEQLIQEGRAAMRAGAPEVAAERLRRALGLWHGPSYGELAAEPYVQTEAARLDELRLLAVEERVEADLLLGRHIELGGELETLVAAHPYRERLWGQWMLALYRAGRQTDALRAFRRLRRLLAEELGIEPGGDLVALEEAILLHKPELDWTPPPAPESSLTTAAVDVAGVVNTLAYSTAFVGRPREEAQLDRLLVPGPPASARVVTVTGGAGMGKTRLALHAAAAARTAFAGGAWLADLAPLDAPEAVAPTVLGAVGARCPPGGSPLSALADAAAASPLLVVLDNCEHVVAAAAECAEAIASAGPSVVLATSREPLHLPGEHVVVVPPLDDASALTLFVDRAVALDGSFVLDDEARTAVLTICQRLDGMPLAIELAAARVRSMTVAEIAERLAAPLRLLRHPGRTVPRHQTLRAALQWSYDLLEGEERDVFPRLSVFASPFSADAVAGVCDDGGGDVYDALAVMDGLVARSMVVVRRTETGTRYGLLDTLRHFGAEVLAASGGSETHRQRHARYYLALAQEARRQLSSRDAAAGIRTFADAWNNLRLAFEWLAATGDVDGALALVLACHWFATLNLRADLLPWAEQAIVLDGAREHPSWSAAAGTTAMLRRFAGDIAGADRLAREALAHEASRSSRPCFEPALALWTAAHVAGRREAKTAILPALQALAERDADPVQLGTTWYVSVLTYFDGDIDRAATIADLGVQAAEATGNPHQLAYAYTGRVVIAVMRDRHLALDAFAQARRWCEIAGNRLLLDNLPLWLAMGAGDDAGQALALLRQSLTLSCDTGYWGNLDMIVQEVVPALVTLGRHSAAAVLRGGIANVSSGAEQVARVDAALADRLGPDCEPLLEQGRRLSRRELAQRALAEVDAALAEQPAPSSFRPDGD